MEIVRILFSAWESWYGSVLAPKRTLRYNAYLLALADQTKTQELLVRGRGAPEYYEEHSLVDMDLCGNWAIIIFNTIPIHRLHF